jgi:hypothetical protein
MSSHFHDLLGGPPPTYLPEDPTAALIADGASPDAVAAVAALHPAAPLPWAILAEDALARGESIEAYAYARTGYHRSLDALRRNGWKGHGPVPWSHVPNQAFLRALYALYRAAQAINETAEVDRIEAFLDDSDPLARAALTAR